MADLFRPKKILRFAQGDKHLVLDHGRFAQDDLIEVVDRG